LGTKGGGAMAAAWAVMHYLGDDGYLRLTAAARQACQELAIAVGAMRELKVLAPPDSTLLAFAAADPRQLDVFALADALWKRGWYVDRQGPPASLHCTVNAVHQGKIAAFTSDLRQCLDDTIAAGSAGVLGAYGTVE